MLAKLKNKKVLVLLFTLSIDLISLGIIIPLIPELFTNANSSHFLLENFDIKYWILIAGSFVGVFSLMQFFTAPIFGQLSDIYGRKKILLIGILILIIANFLFFIALYFNLLLLAFIARALSGIAAANYVVVQASMADLSTEENRAKNFGLIGATFGIGIILGPLFGGLVSYYFKSVSLPFLFSSIFGILNYFFLLNHFQETNSNLFNTKEIFFLQSIKNVRTAFLNKKLNGYFLVTALYYFGFVSVVAFASILIKEKFLLNELYIGIYFVLVGIVIALSQIFLLPLLRKFLSERGLIIYGLLFFVFTLFFYSRISTFTWHLIYTIILAIPVSLINANLYAMISKNTAVNKQGIILGINGSVTAITSAITPILGGLLLAISSFNVLYFFASFLILIAFFVMNIYNE